MCPIVADEKETKRVEADLDPEVIDAIVAKVQATEPEWAKSIRADLAAFKSQPDPDKRDAEIAELKSRLDAYMAEPQRTKLEPGDGKPAAKSGDTPAFYGGDDQYTSVGDDDAEIATNLYIAKTVLSANKSGQRDLSPRGREVMIRAAENALKGGPRKVDVSGMADHTKGAFKADRAAYYADARKAMVSTTSTAGDEWVPTFASAELWTDVHLATAVASRIPRVPMPTNPFTLPTLTSDPTFYYASTENTAVTGSNPGTGNATLTARKIQADVTFSGETTEDSIIAVAPTVRATLVRRGAQTIDDLIVHGDTETGATGNVNTDDAAATAGSFWLALNGMRKFCIVTNTAQAKDFSGAPTSTLFLNTRSLLGKYGARASDIIAITGYSTVNALMDIDDFQTIDRYGANAVVLTGELGRLYGVPILLSESIPGASTDKVDDDGKYTTTSVSTNDTDGWIVLTNPGQWRTGFRRDFQIESYRDIQADSNILVGSFRMALIPSGIDTKHTAYGYNITLL